MVCDSESESETLFVGRDSGGGALYDNDHQAEVGLEDTHDPATETQSLKLKFHS